MRHVGYRYVCCALALAGCGYHWQPECFPADGRPTISIPYIAGDADGSLTEEIARTLAISGVGTVRQWGAQYRLQVAIRTAEGQTIGYRRDRQQTDGRIQKNLVASERRKTMAVEATLYDLESNRIACGPVQIEAYVDFDYLDGDSTQEVVFIGPKGVRQVVLPFSLGQLESSEAAEEAARRPLNVQIAKKIVDVIYRDWYEIDLFRKRSMDPQI